MDRRYSNAITKDHMKSHYPNLNEKMLELVLQCPLPEGCKSPKEIPGMVWIPPGAFVMGDLWGNGQPDERPVRKLNLEGFWIGQATVTMDEFKDYVKNQSVSLGGELPELLKQAKPDEPLHSVIWKEALSFCEWKNRQYPGMEVDLPTEAEWEKAAGWNLVNPDFELGRKYEFATGEDVTSDHANFNREHSCALQAKQFAPGVNGLLGMSGNLWEWCQDVYDPDFYATHPDVVANPVSENPLHVEEQGEGRFRVVLKGGSWANTKRRLRVSNRLGSPPKTRNDNFGFRLVIRELNHG
ncbi:MAG TPA: hypothetical protein EYQ29_14330 [Candidatus Lambdaproteobacteria bacterium]|nr:hypothetical protein [Candidatus Lambdaproteobacteria bacterium]